jgi:long-chain acyl-CoA synthetase
MNTAGDAPFLGKRSVLDGVPGPYVWTSYNEVYSRVQKFGLVKNHIGAIGSLLSIRSAIVARGLPVKGSFGLFSVNRPEWVGSCW